MTTHYSSICPCVLWNALLCSDLQGASAECLSQGDTWYGLGVWAGIWTCDPVWALSCTLNWITVSNSLTGSVHVCVQMFSYNTSSHSRVGLILWALTLCSCCIFPWSTSAFDVVLERFHWKWKRRLCNRKQPQALLGPAALWKNITLVP